MGVSERFKHIEQERPDSTQKPTGANPRFADSAPPPRDESTELDVAGADVQPFVRCAICSFDQHRLSERCSQCGLPLSTPEQKAYNAALWARLRSEQAEPARGKTDPSPAQTLVPERPWHQPQAHLHAGESRWQSFDDSVDAWGQSLLANLPKKSRRLARRALLASAAFLVGVCVLAHLGGWGRFLAGMSALAIAYVFAPPSLRRWTPDEEE